MQPFLHDEVFDVNESLSLNIETIGDIRLIVIDNIFKNLNNVRDVILNSPVGNWKYNPNGKNYIDYYDARLTFPPLQHKLYTITKTIIKTLYQKEVKLNDGLNVNWFKQINEKRSDHAFPHHDKIKHNAFYTCLIYVNTESESSGGTAFFKNKITNNIDGTKLEEIKFIKTYPNTTENGMDYWAPMEYWERIYYVPMKPNRLVIFPAEFYHAAYHPINSFYTFPRLSIAYWMEEIVYNGESL